MIIDRPYEEITIGEKASLSKNITDNDIRKFASITGDFNPIHIDDTFASKTIFKKRIAHGMLTSSLISAVLGTKLPGVNTLYLSQSLKFLAPCFIGDTLTATVQVIDKKDEKQILILKTVVTNQSNTEIVIGEAVVKKMKS
ncbi:MaoC family dehydratase [Crassaminicella thermophila]|uniref:MaoC family dehydratase n=1 Tax=Crassaminicella thermophila TaxID=2599308 RepID=A0A5C0S8Y1_CRATE|nr:MaoC family dehydratase [Crassaminicella thermophila]QEK11125.1 MaoC family dehydratase [Crassaminicella thermophila]